MAASYFGGVEGGATHTKMVLLNHEGQLVSQADVELSTNHWQIGLDECLKRLNDLANYAKSKAGIDTSVPLKAMGMSLSGADSPECSRSIAAGLADKYKSLSEHYYVCCDTVGSIATAFPNGGIVLIAGTGSNCQLINPNDDRYRCGGWGHMMGDEGGAFSISRYCVKTWFDAKDNLVPSTYDISKIEQIICKYFNVSDQMGMLKHLYTEFQKPIIAGMCLEVAKCARVERDALCLEAFHSAGKILAWHILALLPKADTALLSGGLEVVCTGSVFKSWDLLEEGFLKGLEPRNESDVRISEITLKFLQKSAAFGAAYLGAKAAGFNLPATYSENATTFFHHKLNVA